MSVTHASPVCPGSENLLTGHGHRYLRLMFIAYWEDIPPGDFDIYYTNKRVFLTYKGIQQLQADVLALIQANITDSKCLRVTFYSYLGVELDTDDIAQLGWRVVTGTDGV